MDGMDHAGSPVPSDNLIVLEHFDEGVVMNVCGGHKANEALGRAVSVLLSARSGSSVGIEVDAYRVTFRLPKEITATAVMEALKNLEPAHIQGILSLSLKRSSLFKWKLVQIAKKFGAIDADADYEKISIHRLMDLFDKTVISDEAFRELFSLKMDVEKAAEIARRVQSGETGVTIAPISAIGSEGITSSRDLIPPPSTDHAVISTIKKRIENDSILLFCMNCRKWKSKTVVGRVPDDIVCPLCGARLIAALKPYEDDQIAIAKKKNKSKEERAVEIKMIRNANIVLSSGKTAVTALAARGVGPDTASGIIATMAKGDDFYREILKAERNYIRTHRFW
jgi:ATP-dependent Lhr-like helicase